MSSISIPGVEMLEELGRGAHSAVYRIRRGGRYYAAKIPLYSPHQEQTELVSRRFLREAVALARVRHSALPAVLEVGRVGTQPYLIMEIAAGETLAERLRGGPLDEVQVRRLAIQLADALVRVHESGLVHRDIKPANILFDSLTTAARIVDFGLATNANENSRDREESSRGAHVSSHADARDDLFALGSVLFECLTGLAPFVSVDPGALLERHGESSELPPHISKGMARVLRRLLELGTEHAYPDAAALLEDLRELEFPGASPARLDGLRWSLGRGAAVPLLGRERELERLKTAFRVSSGGRGQVVVLRGRPGSGKTRLLRAFAEELTAEHQRLFVVSCKPAQRTPFGVIRQIIEARLDEHEGASPARRLQAIAALRELAADMAPLLRLLSPRLARVFHDSTELPRNDGAEHIFAEGLAEFLSKLLAESGPCAVVVDDLQWMDAGSRRVLGRLADRRTTRVLYLFAARDDDESAPAVERLVRTLEPDRVWDLRLEPLDDARTAELVQVYLGQERLDLDLVHYVVGLSDGTPLSVLEIVRSMLDGGVLVPYWGTWRFDGGAAVLMGLPRGSLELLKRRITELEPLVVHALSAAAVIGLAFDREILSRVLGISRERVAVLLADARRAMLVETSSSGSDRFMHDAVREALLARLGDAETRARHQQIAEVLEAKLEDVGGLAPAAENWLSTTFSEGSVALGAEFLERDADEDAEALRTELVLALATHYSEGERNRNAKRVLDVCAAAGRIAFRSFDNEPALRFFEVALEAAAKLGSDVDIGLELVIAEARLRTGAVEAAVMQFRRVADRAEATVRAHCLSRIAWAEMQTDTERSWIALREAYRTLGLRPPAQTPGALLLSIGTWMLRAVTPRRSLASPAERRRLEVLSGLYYQSARLAADTGNLSLLIQFILRGLEPAERLGPSAALNKSYLLYSFLLTVFGAHRRSRRYLEEGERIALVTRNPVVYAHTLQVHATIAVWAGKVREALEIGARSLEEYGHWRELGEYCATAYNQQQIESVRGRHLEAWKWMDRAIAKLSKHDGPPMALDFLRFSARAALTALGREHEAELLLSRLVEVTNRQPARGSLGTLNYGSRVRLFTECGDLEERFEALVEEVRSKKYNPKRVHLGVTEYYVNVAHARVHACLRAERSTWMKHLPALREALDDLQAAARLPMLKAHAAVISAYHAYFAGDRRRAERLFSRAEAMARDEGVPWVTYAVHRGRAHMLQGAGLKDEARDEARLAEASAREHGAAYRLRWIREEFSLRGQNALGSRDSSSGSSPRSPEASPDQPRNGSRSRARGYLRSLVRVGQRTAKDLALDHQIGVVLDEMIEALRAERGYLFLTQSRLTEDQESRPEARSQDPAAESERNSASQPVAGKDRLMLAGVRSAAGHAVPASGYDPRLVEDLWIFGSLDGAEEVAIPEQGVVSTYADRAVLATPLVVRGGRVGIVYLDRPLRAGPFSDHDARTFSALASQVPLVFELARSLRVRERVEETQRGVEKLEAIGRLAGGIAHDFNNMLSVILTASDQVLSQRSVRGVNDDVRTIQSAAERARDLTRQLLAFSRGQYLNPEVFSLNDIVARLEPIFRRLLGESIRLEIEIDPRLCRVKADPAQIEQVLTNLVVNAGDAMPHGGTLSIQTATVNVELRRAGGLALGRYARLSVTDTGYGMDEATRAKAFEPFFTTKTSGSGLGLATAYGIVTQSGGHIEIDSQLGIGTTFRMFFPETDQRLSPSSAPPSGRAPRGTETILVVDDEPLVRDSTRRMLTSLGYRVFSAKNAEEALLIAHERIDSIDLVISDVIMPDVNGLELARELTKLRPGLRILFVSGYTAGVLAERGVLRDTVQFLQKPVSLEALAWRIRRLLDPPTRPEGDQPPI